MIFSSIFDRKHKGIETTGIGIFWTVMKQGAEAEAIMYAEAQGIITTKDGRVMATYMGERIGRFSSPGKVRFHGSVYFRTTSIGGGKLSFLDNTVGVFEYEGDEQGNCSVRVWEWK